MAELIPRDMLFGNPEKAAPFISPDGTRIAYLAPHEGTLSVWVRTIGREDDRVVASDPARPIRTAFWTPDGTRVLYVQDAAGNENFHLFAADPGGAAAPVDLTPYEGCLVLVQSVNLDRPEVILILMNRRDPQFFDVYRLDPRTGETTLDTENPGGVSSFADDAQMVVRVGVIQHADAACEIVVRDAADAPWRTLARFEAEDGTPQLVGFTPDGTALLAITSADANAARLVSFDLASGERTVVAGSTRRSVLSSAASEPLSRATPSTTSLTSSSRRGRKHRSPRRSSANARPGPSSIQTTPPTSPRSRHRCPEILGSSRPIATTASGWSHRRSTPARGRSGRTIGARAAPRRYSRCAPSSTATRSRR